MSNHQIMKAMLYIAIIAACIVLSIGQSSDGDGGHQDATEHGQSSSSGDGHSAKSDEKLTIEEMKGKNFYQLLKVSRKATDKEVNRAYRKLALKYHPDKNPDDGDARFKLLHQAYDLLKDPEKRNDYDKDLEEEEQSPEEEQPLEEKQPLLALPSFSAEYHKGNLLKQAKLIKLNFDVQKQVLEELQKCASRLVNMFELGPRGIIHTLFNGQICDGSREELLNNAFKNSRKDILAVVDRIGKNKELFDNPNLDAFKKDLLAYTKKPREFVFNSQLLFENTLLEKLQPILKEMASSQQRQQWREEVRKLASSPFKILSLRRLNSQRVLYDSVYIQLSIISATFEAAMIAVENKLKPGNIFMIDDGDERCAAGAIFKQKTMARMLNIEAELMINVIRGEMKTLADLKNALNGKIVGGMNTEQIRIGAVYNSNEFRQLGFTGKRQPKFDALAAGDTEAFAELLIEKVDSAEGYVPNGVEMVIKYRFMQELATLWQLERDFILMEMNNKKKSGGESTSSNTME